MGGERPAGAWQWCDCREVSAETEIPDSQGCQMKGQTWDNHRCRKMQGEVSERRETGVRDKLWIKCPDLRARSPVEANRAKQKFHAPCHCKDSSRHESGRVDHLLEKNQCCGRKWMQRKRKLHIKEPEKSWGCLAWKGAGRGDG